MDTREAELRATTQSQYLINATLNTTQTVQLTVLALNEMGHHEMADKLVAAGLEQMSATRGYSAAWSNWIRKVVSGE